jgi:hypothetical protein
MGRAGKNSPIYLSLYQQTAKFSIYNIFHHIYKEVFRPVLYEGQELIQIILFGNITTKGCQDNQSRKGKREQKFHDVNP